MLKVFLLQVLDEKAEAIDSSGNTVVAVMSKRRSVLAMQELLLNRLVEKYDGTLVDASMLNAPVAQVILSCSTNDTPH